MSMFSFDATAGASQSTSSVLAGNEIHAVKFEGVFKEDIESKNTGKTYKVLKLKFKNENGSFEHSVFEPIKSEGHFDRTDFEYEKNGEKLSFPRASVAEEVMLLLKHLIDAVRPEVGQKIDNKEVQLGGKNWDDLRNNIVTILAKGVGAETNIKLLTDSKGYARFPRSFTGVNREGVAYINNNFIGKKLGFSTYEANKIKQAATAKPTEVEKFDIVTEDTSNLQMDFDVTDLASL